MTTLLEPCDREVADLAAELLEAHHRPLHEAGVSFYWEFANVEAEDGKEPPPALKDRGRQVACRVKVTPYAQRTKGLADAVITLDGDRWRTWSEAEQRAIIDGALESLELVCDRESGDVLADNCGRPRLRVRPGDLHVDGHEAVLRRHGRASLEARALEAVFACRTVQGLLFPEMR